MEQAIRQKAEANRRRLAIWSKGTFSVFCTHVLKDERTQESLELAPHQLEWERHRLSCKERRKFPGIFSMVGSGKSQIYGVGWPIWNLGRIPALCGTITSNNMDTAKKRIKACKDYVEHSNRFRGVFPQCQPQERDSWSESRFTTMRPRGIKDASLQGFSIGAAPAGVRVRLNVNDDICDFMNTIGEPKTRGKIIDYWYNLYDNRLDMESEIVNICTAIHEEDLNAALSADPRWHFIRQGISEDFTYIEQEDLTSGEQKTFPLWDRKWTPEWLKEQHDANPLAFNRAYRNQPLDDSSGEFDKTAINKAIVYGDWRAIVPEGCRALGGVDLSGKGRKGNVIIHIHVGPDHRRYVWADVIRAGAWTSPETAEQVVDACREWSADMTNVEDNAYQKAIIEWIKALDQNAPPIRGFTTTKKKRHETLGIPGLAAEIKMGKWVFIYDREHVTGCKCNLCTLLRELRAFPNSGYSDYAMALWLARQAAMRYGSGSRSEIGAGGGRGASRFRNRREQAVSRLRARREGRR